MRSFVLRGGRLTEGQKRALVEFWPRFGIDKGESLLDFKILFYTILVLLQGKGK